MYVRNMFTRIPGYTLHVMPFDTKKDGMWYFEGQFFYQRKAK